MNEVCTSVGALSEKSPFSTRALMTDLLSEYILQPQTRENRFFHLAGLYHPNIIDVLQPQTRENPFFYLAPSLVPSWPPICCNLKREKIAFSTYTRRSRYSGSVSVATSNER